MRVFNFFHFIIKQHAIGVKKVMNNLALEYCKFDFSLANFH